MPKYRVNVGCNFGARDTRFEPGAVIDTDSFKGLPARIAASYVDQGILSRVDSGTSASTGSDD